MCNGAMTGEQCGPVWKILKVVRSDGNTKGKKINVAKVHRLVKKRKK